MEQLELKFEHFTKRRTRAETRPVLSVQRRGSATINRAAREALGNAKAVDLFFDVQNRILALRATRNGGKFAYPVRPISGKENGGAVISLTALLNHYGIDLDSVRGRYWGEPYRDMLAFDLKSEISDQEKEGKPIE